MTAPKLTLVAGADHQHIRQLLHKREVAMAQTQAAVADAERDPADAVCWPWPDVHAIAAAMVPGTAHTVAAFSGTGKTTLILSALDEWARRRVPIYVLPLETTAAKWRAMWACFRLAPDYPDLDAGDVVTLELKRRAQAGDARARELREVFHEELAELEAPPLSDLVYLEERARELSPEVVWRACEFAAANGYKLVLIDHLDHTDGENPSPYADAAEIIRACLKAGEKYGVAVLGTKQCNNDIVRGPDHLARYQPPREAHIKNGGATREDCTTMLGIFRPIRGRLPDEQPRTEGTRRVDPYVDTLKAARKGLIEPWRVLMPNVTGLVCLKNRPYGRREGMRAFLGFEQGRNVSLSDTQRRDLEQMQHAIATTGGGL